MLNITHKLMEYITNHVLPLCCRMLGSRCRSLGTKDFKIAYYENLEIKTREENDERDENGEWRRLHNEELHSLYRSPNIVRVIKSRILRWTGHVARMEEGRSAFKILTGKTTGKRPLGKMREQY